MALIVLCVGTLMIVLDTTVVNVGLPSIQRDLHFSASGLAWIFFVNLPIGVMTAVMAQRLLRSDRGVGLAAGADATGAVLITGALMVAVYTIVGPAAQHGWGASATLAWGAAAVALLVGFVWREARAAHPLIPLRIFRSRTVTGANLVQALVVAGMFSMFFLGSLYLQRVLGFDALQIGLAFLPTTLIMGTPSLRYSEALMTRFGPRAMLLPGLTLIAAGLGLLARVPVHGSYVRDVLPTLVLVGTGIGISFPSLMTLAMSGATPEDAGLASGLVNTTVQIGGALGLAVLATLAASRAGALRAAGHSAPAALTGGYQLAFAVGAGLVVLALLVTVALLRPERAERVAGERSELNRIECEVAA
jgi:hypothetical protein